MPFISGIITSRITRSKAPDSNLRMPSGPLYAGVTNMLSRER